MIGKTIKYYRLMKGISQENLAQKIGLNKMAVSNYEKDKRNPDMATIQGIAKALDISLAALLSQQDQQLCIEHGAFRKRSTIKKGTQEFILGKLDRYLGRLFNVVSILGEAVLAPRPSIERMRAMSNEEAGQYLRRLLGLPPSGPVGNITDILENKGWATFSMILTAAPPCQASQLRARTASVQGASRPSGLPWARGGRRHAVLHQLGGTALHSL